MQDKTSRLPGEALFALALVVMSVILLFEAYGIAGLSSLSSAGALPLATTFIMVVTATFIAVKTVRLPKSDTLERWRAVLPSNVIAMVLMALVYSMSLSWLGFLPASFLLLTASIWFLRRSGFAFAAIVSAVSLLVIYVIFRLVFSVIMPEGIVPEREIIAFFSRLLSGVR